MHGCFLHQLFGSLQNVHIKHGYGVSGFQIKFYIYQDGYKYYTTQPKQVLLSRFERNISYNMYHHVLLYSSLFVLHMKEISTSTFWPRVGNKKQIHQGIDLVEH